MPVILEGLVTTLSAEGSMHLAAMGPIVEPDERTLVLRPYPTSQTYRNLMRLGEGVFHITDDAQMIARTAVGQLHDIPAHRPAKVVRGFVMSSACRTMEFRIRSVDEACEPVRIHAEILHSESLRDFIGFNRAKHAVIEAAILATRFDRLDLVAIAHEYRKLQIIVDKTGGPQEHDAFTMLQGLLNARIEQGGRS